MNQPLRHRNLLTKLRTSHVPFENAIKLNKSHLNEEKENDLLDKSLLYLTQSQNLIDYCNIDNEYHKLLEQKRHELKAKKQVYKDLKVKLNGNRNVNVARLLKDLKTKPILSIEPIKEVLKQELNEFFNESNKEIEEKSQVDENQTLTLEEDWNFVTNSSTLDKENFEIDGPKNPDADQLEQKYEHLFHKDTESTTTATGSKLSSTLSNNSYKSKSASRQQRQQTQLVSSITASIDTPTIIEKNKHDINHQVVLFLEKNNTNLSLLNKKLESIHRIELPSFQNEFHQICQYGDDDKMMSLVSDNLEFDVNKQRNELGRLGIHECCIRGNFKMLKALIEYIEDINISDNNGQTAAHICARNGELECLKLLAANDANLCACDKRGMQPSHLAAQFNHSNIINFLFQMGISLKVTCLLGKYPLHYAAEHNSYETLKLLTEYYVDVSLNDSQANCAAHFACSNDNLKCLKYLIKIGISIEQVHPKTNRTFAHYCCMYNSVECLHWLLQNGLDANLLDLNGNNLAHVACKYGSAECLNCAIQHDVDLNALNMSNERPLEIARCFGKLLHIEKALTNQIKCSQCVKIALKIKWEKEHEKTVAERVTEMNKSKFYTLYGDDDHEHLIKKKNNPLTAYRYRDTIAQYFGPEL